MAPTKVYARAVYRKSDKEGKFAGFIYGLNRGEVLHKAERLNLVPIGYFFIFNKWKYSDIGDEKW